MKKYDENIEYLFFDEYFTIKNDLFMNTEEHYTLKNKRTFFKDEIDVIIFKNDDTTYEVEDILKNIQKREKESGIKKGKSYVCLVPVSNAEKGKCTFFNGKSFCHFILFDIAKKIFIYDKNFSYFGSKNVKNVMDKLLIENK